MTGTFPPNAAKNVRTQKPCGYVSHTIVMCVCVHTQLNHSFQLSKFNSLHNKTLSFKIFKIFYHYTHTHNFLTVYSIKWQSVMWMKFMKIDQNHVKPQKKCWAYFEFSLLGSSESVPCPKWNVCTFEISQILNITHK